MNGNLEQSAPNPASQSSASRRLSIVGFAALVWFLLRVIPKSPAAPPIPASAPPFRPPAPSFSGLCGSCAGLLLGRRGDCAALCIPLIADGPPPGLCALNFSSRGGLSVRLTVPAPSMPPAIVTRYDFPAQAA